MKSLVLRVLAPLLVASFALAASACGAPPAPASPAPPTPTPAAPTPDPAPVAPPPAPAATSDVPAKYRAIVEAADRLPEDKLLDEGRHPAQLLAFFSRDVPRLTGFHPFEHG